MEQVNNEFLTKVRIELTWTNENSSNTRVHTASEQDESVIVMSSAPMLRRPVSSARVLGSSEIAGLAITTD